MVAPCRVFRCHQHRRRRCCRCGRGCCRLLYRGRRCFSCLALGVGSQSAPPSCYVGCWIRQCVWSRHRSLVPCGVLMTGSPVQTGPHRTGCTCRVFTRKGWLTGWSVFVRRNCRFGYMSHADDLPTKLPQWTSVSCTEQCGDPYAIAHTPAGRPAGLSARPSASPHARRARVRSATAGTRSISSVSTAHAASSRGISAVSTAHIASFGGISAVSSAIFSVLAMRNSPRCSQVYSGV